MTLQLFTVNPLPNECAYGIVAAFAAKWFRGGRQGARVLLNGTTPCARDIPARMRQLAAAMPADMGMDAATLVMRHTLLPLHLPFLAEERRAKVIRAATTGVHAQLVTGLAASRLVCARAMRLCMRCARKDKQRYGRAYWHREHQAHGVLVCPHHGIQLTITEAKPERQHGMATFVTPSLTKLVPSRPLDSLSLQVARKLSRNIYALLGPSAATILPGPERLQCYYHRQLLDAGYGMPNESVAISRLRIDMQAYFGPGFLRLLRCQIPRDGGWVAALIRRHRAHQQPVRHLLLLQFLGKGPPDLAEATGFGPAPRGFNHPYRIKDPRKRQQMARAKRISWLSSRKRLPASSRLALYAWLWRNDRTWLRQHRAPPARRTVDLCKWVARDRLLSARIRTSAKKIFGQHPPRRVSRNAIASACHCVAWLANKHHLLPRAKAVLEEVAESAEAFAIRRLKLIAKRHAHHDIPRWKLRVMAGISVTVSKKPLVSAALRRLAGPR